MSFQNSYRCSLDITLFGIILINIHQFMKVRNSSTTFHTHTHTFYIPWNNAEVKYTHKIVNLKFNQSWKENLLLYSLNLYFQVTHLCSDTRRNEVDRNLYLFGPTWNVWLQSILKSIYLPIVFPSWFNIINLSILIDILEN